MFSLNSENAPVLAETNDDSLMVETQSFSKIKKTYPDLTNPREIKTEQEKSERDLSTENQVTTLPLQFTVLGTRKASESQKALCLIQYQQELFEYTDKTYILQSDMLIDTIEDDHIIIVYKGNRHKLTVKEPNYLAKDNRQQTASHDELLAMTAQDVGTRPRILEHIFTMTSTPFIADGLIVSPGINPALFEQAGFKKDDVLKTINGKSLTIEDELEEIKALILNASTLTFTVMRKGRVVTLYLDIPSEALEMKADI